jgi:hypothetical protein
MTSDKEAIMTTPAVRRGTDRPVFALADARLRLDTQPKPPLLLSFRSRTPADLTSRPSLHKLTRSLKSSIRQHPNPNSSAKQLCPWFRFVSVTPLPLPIPTSL